MNSENTELRSAHKALCHGAPAFKAASPSQVTIACSSRHLPTAPLGGNVHRALARLRNSSASSKARLREAPLTPPHHRGTALPCAPGVPFICSILALSTLCSGSIVPGLSALPRWVLVTTSSPPLTGAQHLLTGGKSNRVRFDIRCT